MGGWGSRKGKATNNGSSRPPATTWRPRLHLQGLWGQGRAHDSELPLLKEEGAGANDFSAGVGRGLLGVVWHFPSASPPGALLGGQW